MIKYLLVFFVCALCVAQASESRPKVGVCIMATGRYCLYVKPLVESGRQFFCTDCEVTYFVFTDGPIEEAPDVVKIHQDRLGWPFDTMNRFHVYFASRELFRERGIEYIYALDADMRFILPVGREIFSGITATRHFGYTGQRGTYEQNPKSRAYVAPHEGTYYYAGAFYGGELEKTLHLWAELIERVNADLKQDYIAIWHDESHLNRYFIDHPPSLMLPIEYCFPESWAWDSRKIVTLDKDNHEMRKPLQQEDMPSSKWWELSLQKYPHLIHDFAEWWGGEMALSRRAAREHIRRKGYASVLDAGCGFATDYHGFRQEGSSIDYLGVDITPQLIRKAKESGAPVQLADLSSLPFEGCSFDICYVRHLLEHAPKPEEILKELIRTAKKEVLVVFFLKPTEAEARTLSLSFSYGSSLYHNRLSKKQLEAELRRHPRVSEIQWEEVGGQETLLHIYLS